MQLTVSELQEIYESVIKPFGHPDPVGYMVRALLTSDGDADYVGLDGKRGFMPVDSKRAFDMVGSQEVQSLQGNLVTTLAMDRMLYTQEQGSIDKMVVAFHWGYASEEATKEQLEFLNEIQQERGDMYSLLFPRNATVKDVVEMIDSGLVNDKLNQVNKSFVERLLLL